MLLSIYVLRRIAEAIFSRTATALKQIRAGEISRMGATPVTGKGRDMRWKRFLLALGASAMAAGFARADSISSFAYHVTNNQVITQGQSAVIGSQIQTYLKDNLNGSVTFHIENLGSFTDSITEIYFQDGAWLETSPIGILPSSHVTWSATATPDQLPGGLSATPPFTTDISLNSQATQQGGQQKNGINNNSTATTATDPSYVQGDWLDLTFNYVKVGDTYKDSTGATVIATQDIGFQDVLAGLNASDPAARLEIGFHVTGYASSASVVTSGVTGPGVGGGPTGESVPLPPTVAVGGVMLVALAAYRKFRGVQGLSPTA